jgi:hypothetical protein
MVEVEVEVERKVKIEIEIDIHKNTKGMDACTSSYIMYGNVNKRLPVFAISIST